jgi:hypothetical protein
MGVEEYDIVETLFRRQSFPEYYRTLHDLADDLDANELYNTNRPGHVPAGSRFREHVATMKELGTGADRGDTLLRERRQAVRELSEIDLDASVSYMRTIAIDRRDPTILHDLNLPLKTNHQKSPRRGVSAQAAEIHLELRHPKNESGAIIVLGSHVRNGGPHLINICKGEPVSEESWYNPGGHHSSCRRIVLRALEPASKVYVRMRTDRPEGPGAWSQPVGIIVL